MWAHNAIKISIKYVVHFSRKKTCDYIILACSKNKLTVHSILYGAKSAKYSDATLKMSLNFDEIQIMLHIKNYYYNSVKRAIKLDNHSAPTLR